MAKEIFWDNAVAKETSFDRVIRNKKEEQQKNGHRSFSYFGEVPTGLEEYFEEKGLAPITYSAPENIRYRFYSYLQYAMQIVLMSKSMIQYKPWPAIAERLSARAELRRISSNDFPWARYLIRAHELQLTQEQLDVIFPTNENIPLSSPRHTDVLVQFAAAGLNAPQLNKVKRVLDYDAEKNPAVYNFLKTLIIDITNSLKNAAPEMTEQYRFTIGKRLDRMLSFMKLDIKQVETLEALWPMCKKVHSNNIPYFFDKKRTTLEIHTLCCLFQSRIWHDTESLKKLVRNHTDAEGPLETSQFLSLAKGVEQYGPEYVSLLHGRVPDQEALTAIQHALDYGMPKQILSRLIKDGRSGNEIEFMCSALPGYQKENFTGPVPDLGIDRKTFKDLQEALRKDRSDAFMPQKDQKLPFKAFLDQFIETDKRDGVEIHEGEIFSPDEAEEILVGLMDAGFDPTPWEEKGFSAGQIAYIAANLLAKIDKRQYDVDFWNLNPKMSLSEIWEVCNKAVKAMNFQKGSKGTGRVRSDSAPYLIVIKNYDDVQQRLDEEVFTFKSRQEFESYFAKALRSGGPDATFWSYIYTKRQESTDNIIYVPAGLNLTMPVLRLIELAQKAAPDYDITPKIIDETEFNAFMAKNQVDKDEAMVMLLVQNIIPAIDRQALQYKTVLNKARCEKNLSEDVLAKFINKVIEQHDGKDPGYTWRDVSDWCIGKRQSPPEVFQILCKVLDVDKADTTLRMIKAFACYHSENETDRAAMRKVDYDELSYQIIGKVDTENEIMSEDRRNDNE